MKKSILLILLALTTAALGAADSAIWGDNLIPDILGYNKEGFSKTWVLLYSFAKYIF